jgi:DNA-binding CsgD family transcriptional regulator
VEQRVDKLEQVPRYLLSALARFSASSDRPADVLDALLDRALETSTYPPHSFGAFNLVSGFGQAERLVDALKVCEESLADARDRGATVELANLTALHAELLYRMGELATAAAECRWVISNWRRPRDPEIAVATLVSCLVDQDELSEAQRELDRAMKPPDDNDISVIQFLPGAVHLYTHQARYQEALDACMRIGVACDRLHMIERNNHGWRGEAAIVLYLLGREDEARALSHEELSLAQTFYRPRAMGRALRACGLSCSGAERVQLLGSAVEMLERTPARLELAQCLLDHGMALRQAGRRHEARSALERAMDTVHACGARRLTRQAREELLVLGAKPRRAALTGPESLTPAELRVAMLAAEGISNRDIAQRLFISLKTVEVHLTRTYEKLQVDGRTGIAAALRPSTDVAASRS